MESLHISVLWVWITVSFFQKNLFFPPLYKKANLWFFPSLLINLLVAILGKSFAPHHFSCKFSKLFSIYYSNERQTPGLFPPSLFCRNFFSPLASKSSAPLKTGSLVIFCISGSIFLGTKADFSHLVWWRFRVIPAPYFTRLRSNKKREEDIPVGAAASQAFIGTGST